MNALSPDIQAVHERILQAACALFLTRGYRVSMESVARGAGVAKQTVYSHFGNKEGLFRAAVERLIAPLHASLEASRDNLAEALQAFARAHCSHVCTPENIALGRMLIAEAPRFPQSAHDLYDAGSGSLHRCLAGRLQQAMARGRLRTDDPDAAAELFLAMLNGLEPERRLLGGEGRSTAAQERWTGHAVDAFMRAYAPVDPIPDSHLQRNSP